MSRHLKFLFLKIATGGHHFSICWVLSLEKQRREWFVRMRREATEYLVKRNMISSYKTQVLSKSEFSQVFKG